MRIMIVGLGSMGRRRLRLLRQFRPDIVLCGVDMDESRRITVQQEHGITAYSSVTDAMDAQQPEAAIVCTSPLSHAAIIQECLLAGMHVFTELNLVSDGYAGNMRLAEEKNKVLFLSSTFLYREEPRYIIAMARSSAQPLNYRYHVGQYLPDWHPWEDYTRYFVGDARTNGCRELLAIELPWLCAAFGTVTDVQVIKSKMTGLKTAYDDSVMLLLRHETGHMGSVCVDVVSRKAVRLFELYGEQAYITWEGTPDTLCVYDSVTKTEHNVALYQRAEHQEGYASFVVENAYGEELTAFIEAIEQGKQPVYGFAEDAVTLRLIDKIEGIA